MWGTVRAEPGVYPNAIKEHVGHAAPDGEDVPGHFPGGKRMKQNPVENEQTACSGQQQAEKNAKQDLP